MLGGGAWTCVSGLEWRGEESAGAAGCVVGIETNRSCARCQCSEQGLVAPKPGARAVKEKTFIMQSIDPPRHRSFAPIAGSRAMELSEERQRNTGGGESRRGEAGMREQQRWNRNAPFSANNFLRANLKDGL